MIQAESSNTSKPGAGTVVGVYFIGGPVVACCGGIGGHFGERLAGDAGYWIGCYLAAAVACAIVGWLARKVFHANPCEWALGSFGLLLGGHLAWMGLVGRAAAGTASASDNMVIMLAAIAGLMLGLGAAGLSHARQAADGVARRLFWPHDFSS